MRFSLATLCLAVSLAVSTIFDGAFFVAGAAHAVESAEEDAEASAARIMHPRHRAVRNLMRALKETKNYNMNQGSQDLLDNVVSVNDGTVDGGVIKSYVVLSRGKKVAEYYRDGQTSTTENDVFSVQKGFTSTYFGMLIDQGHFQLTEKLESIWTPTNAVWNNVTNAALKQQITIEQLLDSTSGFDDPAFSSPLFDAEGGQTLNGALEFLQPVSSVGEFNYVGFANVLNYAIVERLGVTPQEWASENFFPFLAMESGTDYAWDANDEGVNRGRNGLSLTTLDMAKFGQLLLQKGKASRSNQLVPEHWVEDIASSRVPVPADNALRGSQGLGPDDPLSFGLMYWNIEGLGCYCAFGASGQYICVWPESETVAALTQDFGFGPIQPATSLLFLQTVTDAKFRRRIRNH
eukprot:CAMPEP_0119004650 /NCGR_PEP_ID=MMETSP1176-20130426/1271_1 /TAXON_ID=265551 /ORGANISM="Synedropsis recta cf, Strain CCMP1620" /LENGTH=405 /DNA_ID=CAMNT_0006956385 /DNA_START=21 /DNA_END=1238 /DNA_ORIENTATION=+